MRGELGRDWWSGRQRRRALRTAGRRLRGARCVCVRVWCGIGPSPHRQSGRQPAARCCPFGTTRNGPRSGSRYTRGLLPAPRRALWPRHIKSAAARCITPSAAPASSPRAPNSDSRWRRVPDACSTCCGRGGCRRMHDAAHRWRSARRPLDAFCRSSVLQAAGGCAASRRLVVWRTQARRCAHRWRACRAPPHAPPPRCRCGRMIAASDGAHHPPDGRPRSAASSSLQHLCSAASTRRLQRRCSGPAAAETPRPLLRQRSLLPRCGQQRAASVRSSVTAQRQRGSRMAYVLCCQRAAERLGRIQQASLLTQGARQRVRGPIRTLK